MYDRCIPIVELLELRFFSILSILLKVQFCIISIQKCQHRNKLIINNTKSNQNVHRAQCCYKKFCKRFSLLWYSDLRSVFLAHIQLLSFFTVLFSRWFGMSPEVRIECTKTRLNSKIHKLRTFEFNNSQYSHLHAMFNSFACLHFWNEVLLFFIAYENKFVNTQPKLSGPSKFSNGMDWFNARKIPKHTYMILNLISEASPFYCFTCDKLALD